MTTQKNTFMIGALVAVISATIEHHVLDGFQAAGFGDIREAQAHIFRLLPPEGCRVTELADQANTSKQAIGYLVDYLEERGYLERVPDPTDGRAQIVRRTERGWEVNRTAWHVVRDIQHEWAQQLGEERMAAMLASLNELVRIIGVPYHGSLAEASGRPRSQPV